MKKILKYLSLSMAMAMMLSLIMVPSLKTRAAGLATVTEVTANSISLSWTGGTAPYTIGCDVNAETAKATPIAQGIAANSYKIENLKGGTKYTVVVKDSTQAEITINTVVTNPAKPTNLRQESWTLTEDVTVAWDYDGNASGFQVVYTDDDGDQHNKDIQGTDNKKITLDMADVRYYKVIVRAYTILDNNTKKYGEFSEAFTTFAQPVIEETDDGFAVSVTKAGKLSVKWEKVNEAHGYEIYVSTKKNSGYKKVKKITNKNTTKATVAKFGGKKFSKKKEYYVYVCGYRTNASGGVSRSSSNYVVYYRKGETFIAKKKN